jgi:hypothetical protein
LEAVLNGSDRGWVEAVRRPEDGKLVESLNGSLLVEDTSTSLISPFSLFSLVQFPNLECPTETGTLYNVLVVVDDLANG